MKDKKITIKISEEDLQLWDTYAASEFDGNLSKMIRATVTQVITQMIEERLNLDLLMELQKMNENLLELVEYIHSQEKKEIDGSYLEAVESDEKLQQLKKLKEDGVNIDQFSERAVDRSIDLEEMEF